MEFIRRSSEQEMIQLFQLYDSLMEQRQELENKLDDAEDTRLPLVLLYTVYMYMYVNACT